MEKQQLIDTSLLDGELKDIGELQNQVSKILYNKNPFIRFFYHNKAVKLHLQANDRLINLLFPYAINYNPKEK
jgi:hypothetical protein